MTVLYRCDRCNDVDELHARQVVFEVVGTRSPDPIYDDGPKTVHLCGYCTSLVVGVIDKKLTVDLP